MPITRWEYKGHFCELEIEIEYEPDGPPENQKAWHRIITPAGVCMTADISPYETDPRVIELWIDLHYPTPPKGQNFTLEDLQALLNKQRKEN